MPPFKRHLLPFTESQGFERLIRDYLQSDPFVRKFYDYDDSLDGIGKRLNSYQNKRLNRQNLHHALTQQYSELQNRSDFSAVRSNISLLVHSNTYTVTTGHQLNIFSSPLYIIYKIVSVIKICEILKKRYPENHFIPVYWMATEDHDIDEISSIYLFGKRYQWQHSWKGIAGNMPLDGLAELISSISGLFGESKNADELIRKIKDSYLNAHSLADATRKWVHDLFASDGLVILDGNDASLKKSFSDVMIDEVLNQSSSTLINETLNTLNSKYHGQAKPREINLFYLGNGFRERVIRSNEVYKVLNTELSFTKNEIILAIKSNPQHFSPNVILRPLYQESILPNVAYVGGPAEIAYWLELKTLFNHHAVPMPSLILRSAALIVDAPVQKKMEKLLISTEEIFHSTDEMIRMYILRKEKDEINFEESFTSLSNEFDKLAAKVSTVDPTLVPSVESESHKVISSLKSLEEKILRSKKKKNEIEINQIRKLKEKLFPEGNFQERSESLIPYYLKYGDEFITVLKKNLDPFLKQFIILEEQSEKE